MWVSQRGFSLVSLMVSVGLAGILSVVLMQQSGQMFGLEQRSNQALNERELFTELRLILDDERHCRMSLAGEDPVSFPVKFKKIDIDNLADDSGLPLEMWFSASDAKKRLIRKFADKDKFSKITIETIRLFMNNSPEKYKDGVHTDLGTIRVRYSYPFKHERKEEIKDFLIRILLETKGDETTILGCGHNEKSGVSQNYKRMNCKTSGYVNDWDQPLDYTCPGNQIMAGEVSDHNNKKEDRRYRFTCCDMQNEDGENLERDLCMNSGPVNHWDQIANYNCPKDWLIVGQQSYHNNFHEDRIYSYTCCNFKGSNRLAKVSNPTVWANSLDGPVNYTCPKDQFICGSMSEHLNSKEDRLFLFRCCQLEGNE